MFVLSFSSMELSQAVTTVIGVLIAASVAQDELEFRFSGTDVKSGRLEASYEGSWHVVDHNAFRWNTSQVVCRQMGYKYACRVRPCKSLSREELNESGCSKESNTSIRLNRECDGTEKNVSQCLKMKNRPTRTLLIDGGILDVGVEVTCADDDDVDVRLEGGILESEGFLQMKCRQNGSWLVFCAHKHLDLRDGGVACRHLGQKPVARVERRPYFGAEEVVSDSIFCAGDETHLLGCAFNETQSNCSKTNSEEGVAWITCSIEISYNDENVAVCGSDHSCKNRCWAWSGTVNCKCDSACKIFGDCCHDFNLYCASTVEQNNDTLAFPDTVPAADYTCYSISVTRPMFYVVTKCLSPREYVSNTTSEQCENKDFSGDFLLHLPVFDSHGVVYKNVFCALCSGVQLSNVTAWYIKVDQQSVDKALSNETNSTSSPLTLGSMFLNNGRRFVIDPPDAGQIGYPRWCTKYREPSCEDPPNTSSFVAPLSKQLTLGGIFVYYHNPIVYRCDFQESTSIKDICTPQPDNCHYDSYSKYNLCSDFSNVRGSKTPVYITLLFDFSNTDSLAMEVIGESCTKPGEIFDVFLRKCRFLGCPSDYRLHNNICEDHQSSVVRTCIMDIPKIQWPYDSVHLYKSTENMYEVFLSAEGLLGALFLKFALQKKFLSETVTSSHNLLCNVTSFVVGIKTGENPECREPTSFLQPFNLPATYIPFFVYQYRSTLEEVHVYQETLVTENCWKQFGGNLQCESSNRDSGEFEIIDHTTVLYKKSDLRITVDAMKVNMDGTIEVCKDDFSGTINTIVAGTHTLGSFLSFGLLLFTLVSHVAINNLRTLIRICLMNIIAGLYIINIVHFFNDRLSSFLCMIASIMSHFSWIYIFSWATNVFSIVAQTWGNKQKLLHMQHKRSKYLALYTVTSWIFAWVVIIVSVFLHHCNCIDGLTFRYGEEHFCWISVGDATKFVLGVPIGLLLLVDAFIFIVAKLDSSKQQQSNNHRGTCGSSPPPDYLPAIMLFLSLHGIFLIGFLHFLLRNKLLELLFSLAIYMESLFIFGAFVPFRKIVKMLQLRVRNYFHRCQGDSLDNRVHFSHDDMSAKYNVSDAGQLRVMKQLDNIVRN